MGSGASKKHPSPALHKYFETMQKLTIERNRAISGNPALMLELAMDEEKQRLYAEEERKFQDGLVKKLVPLIENSFHEHNRNKDDVLDQAESSLWFSHYIYEKSRFDEVMLEQCQKQGLDIAIRTLAQLAGNPASQLAREKMEQALKDNLRQFRERLVELQQQYQANKAAKDAAAFRVLDVNSDGKLQLAEVVEALTPGKPQNARLQKALGFDSEELAKQMNTARLQSQDCCLM